MKIFRYLLPLTLLFILVPQFPGRPAQETGEFQQLTLTLATPKKKYVELQPIPIVVTLKNDTNTTLVGHSALAFDSSYLKISVDAGDGLQEIRQLSLAKGKVVASAHELQPGEEVTITDRLNFNLNKVFPQPGTYKLQARLMSSDWKESVSSKPLEIEIVQPVGLDAQALEFIRNYGAPAFFFTGAQVMKDHEKFRVLENFVALYGQSAYADEASFLLGEVQFAKREYERARPHFEKLSKKSDYAFAKEASEYLKRIEREEKKKDRP